MSKRSSWLLCLIMLLMPLQLLAEQIPVAIVTSIPGGRDVTLTFTFVDRDSAKSTSQVIYYDLVKNGYNRMWENGRSRHVITKVTIDKSFANARPTTTSRWFYSVPVDSIEGLRYLNTEDVTNMSGMFEYCTNMTSLDLSHFNTAKVTNMSNMFADCYKLNLLNISSFNTSNVTDMSSMFYYCNSLKSLDISKFDMSKVTSADNIISNCEGLAELNLGNNSLQSYSNSFDGIGTEAWPCYLAKESGFNTSVLGTPNAKGFYKWNNGWFSLSRKIESALAKRLTNEAGENVLTFNYGEQDLVADKPDEENIFDIKDDGSTPRWTYYINTQRIVFEPTFARIRVHSLRNWFYGLRYVTSIDGLQYLNTDSVTDMRSLFNGCNSLKSLDVSTFKTSNVTNMSNMFAYCNSLGSIDVSKFNTSKVTDMYRMFFACTSLSSLDISNFDLTNNDDISGFLTNCENITKLNVGNNDFKKFGETYSEDMGSAFTGIGPNVSWPCYLITGTEFNDSVLGQKDENGIYRWNGGRFVRTPNINAPVAVVSSGSDNGKTLTFSVRAIDLSKQSKPHGENGVYAVDAEGLIIYAAAKGNNSQNGIEEEKLPSRGRFEYYRRPAEWTSEPGITTVVFDKSFAQSRPTSTSSWFYGMKDLHNVVGIENLNTSETRNMGYMFRGCSSLSSIDISSLSMDSCYIAGGIFYGCTGLKEINVGNHDFSDFDFKDSLFAYVGTPESPCKLTVGSNFDKTVLGTAQGTAGKMYYLWLNGYFNGVDGTPTGINAVETDEKNADEPAYNIAGQRVGKDYRGIVIVKGRKYIRR